MEKQTKKIIIRTVNIVLLLIILLFAAFLAAFASKDPQFKASEPEEMDYFTGAKIVQAVLNRTLKSKNPSEIKVLSLKNREVQSLIRLAENGESLLYLITGRRPSIQNDENVLYKIAYDKEVYSASIKLTETFCNLCFVGHADFKLAYKDGKLEIDILSLKVGRTEVPDFVKEKFKAEIYEYLRKEPAYDAVREAVVEMKYYSNGDADIHYYPYRLKKYFKGSFLGF